MNESEPKPQEQNLATYESQVQKGYSEFGQEGLDAQHWGTMINTFSGERFNGYSDKAHIIEVFVKPILSWLDRNMVIERQIRIADFGGDDGFLLNEVSVGIRTERSEIDVTGVVVDVDSTGKARVKFAQEKDEGHRNGLDYFLADMTESGLVAGSLDVVICRMAMQYLDEEQQGKFLAESCRVLRENGLLIIETIADYSDNEEFNRFWSDITAVISKGSDFKRKFPAFGTFLLYLKTFKEYQLETVFGSRHVDFPFSVSAFSERFKLSDEQIKELNRLFQQEAERFPDMFTEIDGALCLKASLMELSLEKNTTGGIVARSKMSLEQIQNPPNEESLGLKIDSETTEAQAESIFGKALKCFKKWTGFGATVISMYVGGEKLVESENDMNSYRESVVYTLSGEDHKLKDEQDAQIKEIFGDEVVRYVFYADMYAHKEKQKSKRMEPEIKGFDERFAKYGTTENYFMYPKGWINGEVGVVEYKDERKGNVGAIYNEYFGHSRIIIYSNGQTESIGKGILEHELGHANDWETDMDLNILERQQLLLSIHGRLMAPDRYQSDYYNSFNDGTKEGLYRSVQEYWAEICGEYFTNPQSFLEKHPVDFALVDEYVRKNDPSFDIFNPNRGAFDTQTGKLKDVWVGK